MKKNKFEFIIDAEFVRLAKRWNRLIMLPMPKGCSVKSKMPLKILFFALSNALLAILTFWRM